MNRSTRLYGTTGSIDSIPSHLYNTSNLRPGLVGVDLLVELVPSPAVPHLRAKSLVENQTPHGHAACDLVGLNVRLRLTWGLPCFGGSWVAAAAAPPARENNSTATAATVMPASTDMYDDETAPGRCRSRRRCRCRVETLSSILYVRMWCGHVCGVGGSERSTPRRSRRRIVG